MVVAIAMLMATMTSCKKHDGQFVIDAPISFIVGDVLYSSDFEPLKFWAPQDNSIYIFNEGGYDLTIRRDKFTSKESTKKANLHLYFRQDAAIDADIIEIQGHEIEVEVIEIGKPYNLLHSGVSLYDTNTTHEYTYSAQEGTITFTEIVPPYYFFGTFAFTAIDELGSPIYIAGIFENIEIRGGRGIMQVVDHKTQEKLFMLGTDPEK